MEAFALDCGYAGPPFRWDEERRFLLRCELDAAFFHLYLGPPEEWGRLSARDAEGSGEERVASSEIGSRQKADGADPTGYLATSLSPLVEMFPTPRDAVAYIMETFPIVRRKDIARTEVKNEQGEVIREGTYITKETILAIYDEMQQAIDTGQPYQTRLDPPPGPPEAWRVEEERVASSEIGSRQKADGADPAGYLATSLSRYVAPPYDPTYWPSHIHPPKQEPA